MSYQETVIKEIQDLYSGIPSAFIYDGAVFKTLEWSCTKKGKCYGIIPEGFDSIEEDQEYYIGRCGEHVVAVVTDRVNPLYTKRNRTIEEVAENICIVLDVDPDEDNTMDNDDYGMWQ